MKQAQKWTRLIFHTSDRKAGRKWLFTAVKLLQRGIMGGDVCEDMAVWVKLILLGVKMDFTWVLGFRMCHQTWGGVHIHGRCLMRQHGESWLQNVWASGNCLSRRLSLQCISWAVNRPCPQLCVCVCVCVCEVQQQQQCYMCCKPHCNKCHLSIYLHKKGSGGNE